MRAPTGPLSRVPEMKLLSNSEVARQAGVNPAQLCQWLATGKVERPKMSLVGGRIMFVWTEADIERVRAYKARTGNRSRRRACHH
jgi:MerR HTH family regulatory protein